MKRLLMALAIAGFAVACGDDDGDNGNKVDSGLTDAGPKADTGVPTLPDSGATDGGPRDSGMTASGKVANTGLACTTATAAATCGGSEPVCRTTVLDVPTAPVAADGYCSASCTAATQCGTGGVCPVGEAIATVTAVAPANLSMLTAAVGTTGYCAKGCTPSVDGGVAAGCRAGQICASLNDLTVARGGQPNMQLAPLSVRFCMPAASSPTDGGVDAGTDAGANDAGVDAGPADAGSDAGFDAAG